MISKKAIQFFDESKTTILGYVNKKMLKKENLNFLIGDLINIPVMLDNHRNHIAIISIVLKTGNIDLLDRTLPRVYHSYHSQGFAYDYFKTVLQLWKEAISNIIIKKEVSGILDIYDRILGLHNENINQSELLDASYSINKLTPVQQRFSDLLITGCQRTVFSLTDAYFEKGGTLRDFYDSIITPAMYNIGYLWEYGHISVAEEHLASSIILRVLATHYTRIKLPDLSPDSPKIMICASANEYHEIGAWMIANLFEEVGWDVNYLGSNTPIKDIVQLVMKFKPSVLGISITMAFNLDSVMNLIGELHQNSENLSTKIMLGGNLFSSFPNLGQVTKADYIARGFDDALNFANQLI